MYAFIFKFNITFLWYNMHTEGLLPANLCLITKLSSEQCLQFERLCLQHIQMINKRSSFKTKLIGNRGDRALCKIQLLPVTHVLVNTWIWTSKPVYKLSNVVDDLKWTTNTCDTIYTHFQGITNNIWFWKTCFLFLLLQFFTTRPPIFLPVHIGFYPSRWWMAGSLH